jgi:hypothetical protein
VRVRERALATIDECKAFLWSADGVHARRLVKKEKKLRKKEAKGKLKTKPDGTGSRAELSQERLAAIARKKEESQRKRAAKVDATVETERKLALSGARRFRAERVLARCFAAKVDVNNFATALAQIPPNDVIALLRYSDTVLKEYQFALRAAQIASKIVKRSASRRSSSKGSGRSEGQGCSRQGFRGGHNTGLEKESEMGTRHAGAADRVPWGSGMAEFAAL